MSMKEVNQSYQEFCKKEQKTEEALEKWQQLEEEAEKLKSELNQENEEKIPDCPDPKVDFAGYKEWTRLYPHLAGRCHDGKIRPCHSKPEEDTVSAMLAHEHYKNSPERIIKNGLHLQPGPEGAKYRRILEESGYGN